MVRMEQVTTPEEKARSNTGRGRWIRLGLGLAITVACVGFIVSRADFGEVRKALAHFNWFLAPVGLASLSFGYGMRIVRWALMLRAGGANVSIGDCAAPFLGSIALNNVLPFRAGDVVRALVFPGAIGVRRTTAAASLVLERLVDLLSLLLCLGAGLTLSGLFSLRVWMKDTVLLLAVGGVGAMAAIAMCSAPLTRLLGRIAEQIGRDSGGLPAKVLRVAIELMEGAGAMSRPRVLIVLFALSMLVWAGETGLFLSLIFGLGLHAGLAAGLLIMAVATLSTLVPSSPGYVGPFHLAVFSAVSMLGGSSSQAASLALLTHLGLWLPTTLAGSLVIAANPQLLKAIKGKYAADSEVDELKLA
jgi:glycosyltransferase 2 family protein